MSRIEVIRGVIVDVVHRCLIAGEIRYLNGRIVEVVEDHSVTGPYILPGLIDAHVHVESSMMVPSEFARMAVVHGTVGSVSDPHEIANVLGAEGVKFMISNGARVPFRFSFGAPSCVPATSFESSGAVLGATELQSLFLDHDLGYMSEMMNFPGVIHGDAEVKAKLDLALRLGKPVDGHAPGLRGKDLKAYADAGISTDHECFDIAEAREKIALGIRIQIREGSAARNFEELIPLMSEYPEMIMLCSDDKHPDDFLLGHINLLVGRAIRAGYDLFDVLRSCTLVPRNHYGLDNGLLQEGDFADMILVDDLSEMNVQSVWIAGQQVARDGECLIPGVQVEVPNVFEAEPLNPEDINVPALSDRIRVIQAHDGQLITSSRIENALIRDGNAVSDPERDILKLLVYNRYRKSEPAMAFITGLGLKNAAIASTVAHDSHNIIAAGSDDALICKAVNLVIEHRGGICIVTEDHEEILPLPVAGIMSDLPGKEVARLYLEIDRMAKKAGSELRAPFMTLSFMALLVIPELKLSDKGLFDGNSFSFTNLFEMN